MRKFTSFNALPKLSLVLSLALITGFVQNSAAQEVITIQDAIDKTLNNNLTIKQSQFSESLADENLKQSKLALVPTLSGSISSGISFGRSQDQNTYKIITQKLLTSSGSLSSGVTVFEGWSKINQIKQNKLLLDAGKANTDKVKNDLILQVVTSYLQILYNIDLLKAANVQLGVAKQQLNREQQLLDVGNKTLADLSQAKSQLATAELNVTNADNALTISYLTLAQLMDVPSSTKYEVKAPLLESFSAPKTRYNPDEVYADAIGLFPDIKLAALRTEAAKKGVDVAKGALYPRLGFNAGLGSSYSYIFGYNDANIPQRTFSEQLNDRFGQNIGLSLSIPIFNGLQARSGVRKAKISLLQTQTDEQLAKNNLNKVIYQAVADLKAAESRYRSTTNTFQAQKDAFNVIEQRYAVGLVNSLDYSTSQSNMNKAEVDMIQAKYDLLFRAKVIDYYLGKQIIF
ncbi:TolC family protein [Pedobacter sp. KBW06]|uniref:TolC family protein n=1 Tax=Pedobacter sp. KBW06 TaxID=2153359 RepID=UPI000F5AAE0D|nr:TolC family protein [Pedobacter sp. KBW06]RQO72008.1 TolC family protein [Pedobacter sp. KBW06]